MMGKTVSLSMNGPCALWQRPPAPSTRSSMDASCPCPRPQAVGCRVSSWGICGGRQCAPCVLPPVISYPERQPGAPVEHTGRTSFGQTAGQGCQPGGPSSRSGWDGTSGLKPSGRRFACRSTCGPRRRPWLLCCEPHAPSHLPRFPGSSLPVGLSPLYPASVGLPPAVAGP